MEPSRRSERFEDLFARYVPKLLGYAMRRVQSPVDAEDAVAEAYVVAWRRLDEVPDEDGALPWLYAVCRRVIANQRRATRRRESLLNRLRRLGHDNVERGDADPGPASAALGTLGDDDQELLRLIAWDELPYSQIALMLGVTPNAVAVRAHRARARLRTALQRALPSNDQLASGHSPPRAAKSRREQERDDGRDERA